MKKITLVLAAVIALGGFTILSGGSLGSISSTLTADAQLSQVNLDGSRVDTDTVTYNFDDGTTQGWTIVNPDMSVRNDVFESGRYSLGISENSAPANGAYIEPSALAGGNQISNFSFKYYELSDSSGGGVQLLDSSGSFVLGVATDNPQWDVIDANSSRQVFDPRNSSNGTLDYDEWVNVNIDFRWNDGEADVTFTANENPSITSTETVELAQDTNISRIQLDNYTSGAFQTTRYHMWYDDISFTTKSPADSCDGIFLNDECLQNQSSEFTFNFDALPTAPRITQRIDSLAAITVDFLSAGVEDPDEDDDNPLSIAVPEGNVGTLGWSFTGQKGLWQFDPKSTQDSGVSPAPTESISETGMAEFSGVRAFRYDYAVESSGATSTGEVCILVDGNPQAVISNNPRLVSVDPIQYSFTGKESYDRDLLGDPTCPLTRSSYRDYEVASYLWSSEDGAVMSGESEAQSVIEFDSTGTKEVSLQVADDDGGRVIGQDTETITFTVDGSLGDFSLSLSPETVETVADAPVSPEPIKIEVISDGFSGDLRIGGYSRGALTDDMLDFSTDQLTLAAGESEVVTLEINIDANGLPAGTYPVTIEARPGGDGVGNNRTQTATLSVRSISEQ